MLLIDNNKIHCLYKCAIQHCVNHPATITIVKNHSGRGGKRDEDPQPVLKATLEPFFDEGGEGLNLLCYIFMMRIDCYNITRRH